MEDIDEIVYSHLIQHFSELSDSDYQYLFKSLNLTPYENKHIGPPILYGMTHEKNTKRIYMYLPNRTRHYIGHYSSNNYEIAIYVPYGFIKKNIWNALSNFNTTKESEKRLLSNLIYLDKFLYYSNNQRVLESQHLKFSTDIAFLFKCYEIRHTSVFVISKNNRSIRLNYEFYLYNTSSKQESYHGSIQSVDFRSDLENCISTITLEIFNKNFSRLSKKELLVFKMMNIQ